VTSLSLPDSDATWTAYELQPPTAWTKPSAPFTSRVAYAAAHVVPRALGDNTPGSSADIDWEATLAFRRHLWSWGFRVAEAMDTAQRGMGLDWAATQELIKRSTAEARAYRQIHRTGGLVACGAGTDQLDLDRVASGQAGLEQVLAAYLEQLAVVAEAGRPDQGRGPGAIVMASRALAQVASSPADYRFVYDAVLGSVTSPVILHWLGEMFDPALAGYWGSDDVEVATAEFVALVNDHPGKVDGVKVSLLDADHERALRAQLPRGVRLYTGDDFNYPELVCGDGQGHSDALLGIFAAIAPAASVALQALDAGDDHRAREILESTRALGRHIFAAPTYYYKTGIAFLAWLNGHQPGFTMINGLATGRSVPHLVELFRLADQAGLLEDPELAAERMGAFLCVHAGTRPHDPALGGLSTGDPALGGLSTGDPALGGLSTGDPALGGLSAGGPARGGSR